MPVSTTVRRAYRTARPAGCSTNVTTEQTTSSQKNRRTRSRITTGVPSHRRVGEPTHAKSLHPVGEHICRDDARLAMHGASLPWRQRDARAANGTRTGPV
jgi:hypothetical protein